MTLVRFSMFVTLAVLLIGSPDSMGQDESGIIPPKAAVRPHKLTIHNHTRVDNYYWLRDREDAEVIQYLNDENDYLDQMMKHTDEFQESLFKEITGRIKQDDNSVPYRRGDYYYHVRYEEGKEYPFYCRKKGPEGEEVVMLNGPELAEGHEFFAIGGQAVSPEQNILAYAVDTEGRRKYTVKFVDLDTGEPIKDAIPEVTGNMAWAADNRTLFYAKQDPETLRSYQIYRHTLGTPVSDDVLVYEELDETFSCRVGKSRSKKYLMINSGQTLSSELRILEADNPSGEFRVFHPRERDHLYGADHFGDSFYIRTNDSATNFKLMKTGESNTGKSHWREVIAHRDDVLLRGFELFDDHMVIEERENGLMHIRIIPNDGSDEHYLDFGEPTYRAFVSINMEPDTQVLRYGYTSMTTPNSTFDYDMVSRKRTLLKQEEIIGDFDSANYVTERLEATARDGVKVPISLVYRKGTRTDGSAPTLQYGYGSYGSSMDATFSSSRLSLLDRGFVYAIAHIRGGQEMGRQWYEDGKLLKKKNTFSDFIDCAEHLVREGYADKNRLFAMGGSAGGLLMGAVTNMRPDLFTGIVAGVPFVDVITTMLDDSIPLTTSEYDEWGNPNEKQSYDYMLSYSPYDQVIAVDYPHLLVTTGLHDSQVQYWEPAKWVAKLRATKTGSSRLLLKTNMEAGHGGASGRFKRYKETALEYAFILDLSGITK